MSISATARKITLPEQTRQRRSGQWTEWFCLIDPSPSMWTAILDGTQLPSTNDGVYRVPYTTGTLASGYTALLCLPGATLRVGTTPGGRDLGSARLRADSTGSTGLSTGSGILNVNETSEIRWLSGDRTAGTGTASIDGTISVVGIGTLFVSEVVVGQVISLGGESRVVATIIDNLHLTVGLAFTSTQNDLPVAFYSAQSTVYLTLVDEFTLWPRDLRVEGPNAVADLLGYVTVSAGTNQVRGASWPFASNTVWADPDGTINIVQYNPAFPTSFTTQASVGDDIYLSNYGLLRRVVGIASNTALTVDSPVTRVNTINSGYAFTRTRFLSQLRVGDNLTIGGESHQIAAITDDHNLIIDGLWEHSSPTVYPSITAETYSVTRLSIFMDYDRSLETGATDANQHYVRPSPVFPNIGPSIVVEQFYSNPVVIPLSADAAWGFDADEPTDQIDLVAAGHSFLWRTTGGTLSSSSSSTPTLTVTAPGVYRVSCAILPLLGDVLWRHQKIYVVGNLSSNADPLRLARLSQCEGDVASGWSAQLTVTLPDSSSIRDRAQAVLFARDHYGTDRQGISQLVNRSNIVMTGWVVGETIQLDPELPEAGFRIEGPLPWLSRMTGLPTAFEHVTTVPGLWTQFYHLTVDRALWHLLTWRSTLPGVADVYLTGDLTRLFFLEGQAGNLASQIQQISAGLLARLTSDRFGRVFVEIDPQLIPSAARTTPVVQKLTTSDLSELNLRIRRVPEVGQVMLSGTAFDGTNDPVPHVSASPGGIRQTFGTPSDVPSLALNNQIQADRLSRLVLNNRNNPTPSVSLRQVTNSRLIDVAPAMYVDLDVPASLNPRGVALSDFPFIVTHVSYTYDPESGTQTVTLSGEGFTDETTHLDGALPARAFTF